MSEEPSDMGKTGENFYERSLRLIIHANSETNPGLNYRPKKYSG